MKQILFTILILLSLSACEDSEIIIPGEVVGDGSGGAYESGGGGETNNTILVNYTAEYTNFAKYQYLFNSDGNLTDTYTEVEVLGISITTNNGFSRDGDGKISSATIQAYLSGSLAGTETVDFAYNSDDKIETLNSGGNIFTITYNGNSATGTLTESGTTTLTSEYNFDGNGKILNETITSPNFTETYVYEYTYSGSNLTQVTLTEDGTTIDSSTFTYDAEINPIYNQFFDEYLAFYYLSSISFDNTSADLTSVSGLENFVSSNNVVSSVINSNGYTFDINYNSDNYPTNGLIKDVSDSQVGTITYTYN